jgi:aminopeptidase N
LQLANDYKNKKPLVLSSDFIEAMRSMLSANNLDNALKAQILTLPSETYLGEQVATIDVDAIYQARRFVRMELARELKSEFERLYQENQSDGDYEVSAEAFAQRSLKNICLGYLALLNDPPIRPSGTFPRVGEGVLSQELCVTQFKRASNMTDSLAALQALANLDCPERVSALADFYTRWKDEPLVLDKWFMLQATSELPDTLAEVKKLTQHPAFNLQNPNRVRALIGGFCSGNFIRFHDVSGSGYAFLADQVLALDKLNPQIAARLVQPLTSWRRYDSTRQALMKAQLERLAKTAKLSKNVYEIVEKSLN